MESNRTTHNLFIGYIAWLFGFIGAHRFYYGKPLSGTLYFFTMGFLLIGWIVDLFLIPQMDRESDIRYIAGPVDYNVAWLLLIFLGVFGIHRLYMGKIGTGIVYLLTFGIFGLGYIYDMWTLNEQVSRLNSEVGHRSTPESVPNGS
ncbi:MAG: TM2 domain-containing protein [Desulfobulbus sp.]|nr:TM2 domain-containing protein [Desulfobulbus sp.]